MLTFDELRNLAGESGLTTSQVAEFRKKFGTNIMTPPVREPLWKQYLKKFNDPIIKILLFAVAISAIISGIKGSGFLDTIGIILAILLLTGISFFNEYRRAKNSMCSMHIAMIWLSRLYGMVTRYLLHPVILWSGTSFFLKPGTRYPLMGGYTLLMIFLLMSPHSAVRASVEKEVKEGVLKGSFVTAGRGQMLAGAVGDAAQMGVIAASLGIDHATRTRSNIN